MINRNLLLILLAVSLLSVGLAMAQGDLPAPEPAYRLERILPGSEGSHSGLTWQFCGVSSSSRYRLVSRPDARSAVSGCCCSYLPLVKK